MSRTAVVLPAAQVLPVLDGLLSLYEVRTEAILQRVREHAGVVPPTSVASVIDAIEQLGWSRVPHDEPIELTTAREVIATAVHAALTASAEQVVRACSRSAISPDHRLYRDLRLDSAVLGGGP